MTTNGSSAANERLAGKVALVTGGASGIGAACAKAAAAAGARVAIVDRDADGARKNAEALGGIALQADVARSNDVDAAFEQAAAALGPVDVVIHCAGVDDPVAKEMRSADTKEGRPADVTSKMTDEMWHRVIGINLDGTFYVMRAALRGMNPRGQGSIVTIASVAGIIGTYGLANYSASKGGVLALTRAVAKEAALFGVRVNTIAPGAVDTPLSARSDDWARPADWYGPLRRKGHVDEIASVAVFLSSDEASYIVGETVNVSGGMVML